MDCVANLTGIATSVNLKEIVQFAGFREPSQGKQCSIEDAV